MSGWTMYFFVILDGIREVFACFSDVNFFLLIVSFILGIVAIINYCTEDYSFSKIFTSKPKITILVYSVLILSNITLFGISKLLPSTKQMAAIYVVPKVINNANVKELPDNVLKWLNDYVKNDLGGDINLIKNGVKTLGNEAVEGVKDLKNSTANALTTVTNETVNAAKNKLKMD